MNIDDQATQQEEFQREQALKLRKHELPKIGSCYNCSEPVKPSANFCHVECRSEFERRVGIRKGR